MTVLEIGPETLNDMSLAQKNNEGILRDNLTVKNEEQDRLIFFDWKRMNVQFGEARFCDLELLEEFYNEKKADSVSREDDEEGTKTVDEYLEWIEKEGKESEYCDFFLGKFDKTSTLPLQMLRQYGEQQHLLKSPVHYLTESVEILSEGRITVAPGDYQYVVTQEEDGTIVVEMQNEIAECYSTDPKTFQKILYQEKAHASGQPIARVSSKMRISLDGEVAYDELQFNFLDSRFMSVYEEELNKSRELNDEQEKELDPYQKKDLQNLYEATYNIVDNYLDVFLQMELPSDVKDKIAVFKSKYSDPDKYNFILYTYSLLKKEQAEREANGRFDAALKIVTDLAEYLDCEILETEELSLMSSMNIDHLDPYALWIKRTKPVYRLTYQEEETVKGIEFKKTLYDALSKMAEGLSDETKKAVFDTTLSVPDFIGKVIKADRTAFLDDPVIVAYCRSKGFTLFQDQSGNVRLYPNTFSEKTPKGYIYSQDENGVHKNEVSAKTFGEEQRKKQELGEKIIRSGWMDLIKRKKVPDSVKQVIERGTSAPNVTYDDFIYDIYYQLKRDQFVSMKASPKARFNSSNMPSNWIFDLLKKSKNIPIQVFEKLLARVRRTNPDDLLTVIALFPEVKKENQAGPFVLHLLDLLELKHQDGTLDDKVTEVLLHGVGVVLKTNPLLFSDDEAAIQKKITAVSATIRSQPRHK